MGMFLRCNPPFQNHAYGPEDAIISLTSPADTRRSAIIMHHAPAVALVIRSGSWSGNQMPIPAVWQMVTCKIHAFTCDVCCVASCRSIEGFWLLNHIHLQG